MSLCFFPQRKPNLWRAPPANAVRGARHPFRMLDLVALLDEPIGGGSCAGARVTDERLGRDGSIELRCRRLVDDSWVWVKPHRLRHLNGPRLQLIDGGVAS